MSTFSKSLKDIQDSIVKDGFCHIKDFLTEEECNQLSKEIDGIQGKYYSKDSLLNRSVYIEDKTDSRHALAIMANLTDTNPHEFMPVVSLDDVMIYKMLQKSNDILSKLTGKEVPDWSRSLINFQTYYGESKPVAEHFDGDLLDCEHGNYENLVIHEALLPQYVIVMVIENENIDGVTGVHLRDSHTNDILAPHLSSGDIIVFDNIRFRHYVPKLDKPRRMLGFRNFDHDPYLFLDDRVLTYGPGWVELKDDKNPGHIRRIDSLEAKSRTIYFNKKIWPYKREDWFKRDVIF